MITDQIAKERLAVDAAFDYVCDPINSLGERKKFRRYPNLTFGPKNWETAQIFKLILNPRKKSFLQQIIDAAEKERLKQMIPIVLYRLEQPKNGEYIDKNPLTDKEFSALLVNEEAPNK